MLHAPPSSSSHRSPVHRSQADALEIEAGAKRRLADEYDAAQERGEIKTQADNRAFSESEKASWRDIFDNPREIHEAREIRDAEQAEPGIVRATLESLIEAGEEGPCTARKPMCETATRRALYRSCRTI